VKLFAMLMPVAPEILLMPNPYLSSMGLDP
jgi:hypothetical protein